MNRTIVRKFSIIIFVIMVVVVLSWDTFFPHNTLTGLYDSMKTQILSVGYSVN